MQIAQIEFYYILLYFLDQTKGSYLILHYSPYIVWTELFLKPILIESYIQSLYNTYVLTN
jgi:hypothetical protein